MKFLLFNRNEELVETLKNVKIAKHTEELNGEDTFEFTVPDTVIDKGYRVVYKDKYGNWKEYIVKGIEEVHEPGGIVKNIFCESSFYETIGDYIDDLRPSNVAANIALANALSVTRWEVGTVDNLGINSTNFYHCDAKSAVQKICEVWKGELRTRVDVVGTKIAHRYVDILSRRGGDLGKRFSYGKDIDEIRKTVIRDDVITALYGYGKGEEVSEGYGRRLDFADINGGKAYVENTDALAIWGRLHTDGSRKHIFGKVEFDDCEDKALLKQMTTDKLAELSVPAITYEAKVRVLNLAHENVGLGDSAGIIDKEFTPELRLSARVIKIVEDLLDEENTEVTFGNTMQSFTDTLIENQQYVNNFRDKQGVWDRSKVINSDGTLNANYILGLLEEFNSKANATGGYVFQREGEGILTINTPDEATATMAIQILGGTIRIANSKTVNGEWNWTTALDGTGMIANVINAGVLQGGKVQFDLENGTLLIGNSITDYALLWDGTKLWLNGTGVDMIASKTYVDAATPHSVFLSNNNYSFATDSDGMTTTSITVTTTVDCFKGTTRMAGTIGTLQLKNATGSLLSLTGVTLSKTNPTASASGSVTMVIAANTNLGSDAGFIEIPITIESSTYTVKLIWNKAKIGPQGPSGSDGESALAVLLLNENQSIACGSGRTASVAQTITIPFSAYLGSQRVAATATYSTLPSGVTLTSNTAATASADGSLVFAVASGATLGGTSTAYDAGAIDVTITANGTAIVKKFNWTKTVAGAGGTTARTYFVESSVSAIVKAESGAYTPTSLTFNAYYKDGTSASKTAQTAYWKIETTVDGQTWTQSATKTDAAVSTYTVTPIPAGIKGIKATIYSNNTLTTTYDSQSVMIVADGPTGPQGIQGPDGADGQTLYTWIKYADSPTTGMSDVPTNKTYIGLAYNKTTATESSNYSDYSWSLIKGADGAQGPAGANGTTTYTWVKYADDALGNGISDDPTGKRYLGLAYNKTTATESTTKTDYSWSPLYDNVQVGGINLLPGTNGGTGWTADTKTGTEFSMTKTATGETGYIYSPYITLYGGQTITLSFESKEDANINSRDVFILPDDYATTGSLSKTFPKATSYTKNSLTFTTPAGWGTKDAPKSVRVRFDHNGSSDGLAATIWVKNVKLEIGNISTDYSMSPEDIQSAIDAANDAAANAQNKANQVEDELTNKANQSDVDDLAQTITTQYSQLTSDNDSIHAEIGTINTRIDSQGTDVETIKTYFDFAANGLTIGKSDSPLQISISNSEMDFLDNGTIVAYINGQKMYIDSLEVITSLIVGAHKMEKYNNNITLVRWVG